MLYIANVLFLDIASFLINMQQNNARVIADSILSLHKEDLISNPLDDVHVTTELREQGVSLGGANEGVGPTTQDFNATIKKIDKFYLHHQFYTKRTINKIIIKNDTKVEVYRMIQM